MTIGLAENEKRKHAQVRQTQGCICSRDPGEPIAVWTQPGL